VNEKTATLIFGSIFAKTERASELYVPNERNASAEALICLNCPLPDCDKKVCKRYKEEKRKLKEGNG
jgi:hypothetical protein